MTLPTPGPWEVIASTSFPGRYLIAQSQSATPVLAVAETIQVSAPEGMEIANARLIAAAPEMYAALEALMNDEPRSTAEMLEWGKRARAAIDKVSKE